MALGDNIRKNTQEQKKFNEAISEGAMAYREYEDLFKSIQGELGKKVSQVRDATKSYDQLVSSTSQLKLNEEEITRLTDRQLQAQENKARAALADLRYAAESLSFQKQQLINDKNGNLLQGAALEARIKSKLLSGEITKEEAALLRAKANNFKLEEEMVAKAGEDVAKRKELNKALGVAGGLLKGMNEIAGPFAQAFQLDKVQEDMEKFAEDSIKAGKSVSRLQTLGVGLKSAFGGLGNFLTDPTVILTNLIKGFVKVDKAATQFARQTGQDMNTLSTSIDSANMHYITMAEYITTASDLTKELGQNANAIFQPEDILEASEMVHAMGMSVEQSNQLAKLSKINGGNIKEQNKALVEGVNSYNKQNKTAYAAGEILRDVAAVSDGIAISYAGYPEKLGEAVTAAKDLGMSLGDVDKIADSLLNFEQSIAKEMEAELLTGKDLNLEKARQAALNNDLETVAKELTAQGVTSAEFASMNRIQQQKMAEAMGMSKDQMAKMLLQQKLSSGISEDSLSAAEKQTLESLKQEEAQEKFTKSIEKLQQALAPIVGFFADILSNSYVIYSVLGVALISKIPAIAKGFGSFKDNLKEGFSAIKGIAGGIKDLATGKGPDALKGAFGMGDKAGDAAGKAGEGVGKAADSTKGVKGNVGKEIEKFLKGVGRGLMFIGQNFADIMKGGLALLVASPGLIALGLAAPGLLVLSMIPGPAVNAALKGVARGIMFFGKNFADVAKGALALGLAGLALGGGFALAMMLVKDVDPGQMIAFAASLTMLGLTMALLGNLGANVFMGAAALAVLGVAMIPAALAFSLLSGLDVGAMIAFSIALPLLALAAAGLGFLAPFIMAGAGALAVLGLALIPASIAFGMLEGVDSEAILGFTKAIGALALTAAGLGFLSFAIFFGAAALTVLGLALIPFGEAIGNISSIDPETLKSFVSGVVALSLAVAGLGIIAPLIAIGSIALTMLGTALIPLATGLEMMSNVDGASIVSQLTELATVAPGLFSTAAALYAVAGGIAAVAVAGYLAVPAMALMSLFSSATGAGEDKKDEGSLKQVEDKLDQLIAIVSAGGDVYMDGEKVGKALQLSSSRLG